MKRSDWTKKRKALKLVKPVKVVKLPDRKPQPGPYPERRTKAELMEVAITKVMNVFHFGSSEAITGLVEGLERFQAALFEDMKGGRKI